MECPVCKGRMQHEKIEGVWVDICHSHGMWLDNGELEKIMELSKHRGESEGFLQGIASHSHSHF